MTTAPLTVQGQWPVPHTLLAQASAPKQCRQLVVQCTQSDALKMTCAQDFKHPAAIEGSYLEVAPSSAYLLLGA
eukprot:5975419-Amphidinium_carterae.1